jgi:hypothetical protein
MKWPTCVLAAALLFFVSGEALAETCADIDAEAKRLLALPAQRSDLNALKHIAKRASENPDCGGEYVFRLARDLVLHALNDLDTKAAADKRPLTSSELEPLSELSRPWQLMTHLGDAYFAEKDWLGAFEAYDIALAQLNTGKSDEHQVFVDAYAKAVVARAFLSSETANDRSQSRPNVPEFRTLRGGPAVERAFLDDAVWRRVEMSSDRRLLQAYLVEFPKGAHAAMARNKLGDLAK